MFYIYSEFFITKRHRSVIVVIQTLLIKTLKDKNLRGIFFF